MCTNEETPVRGFREPEKCGPKQLGSQEQGAKKSREQGEEDINLGSMEHSICHKINKYKINIEICLPLLGTQSDTNIHISDGEIYSGVESTS